MLKSVQKIPVLCQPQKPTLSQNPQISFKAAGLSRKTDLWLLRDAVNRPSASGLQKYGLNTIVQSQNMLKNLQKIPVRFQPKKKILWISFQAELSGSFSQFFTKIMLQFFGVKNFAMEVTKPARNAIDRRVEVQLKSHEENLKVPHKRA